MKAILSMRIRYTADAYVFAVAASEPRGVCDICLSDFVTFMEDPQRFYWYVIVRQNEIQFCCFLIASFTDRDIFL